MTAWGGGGIVDSSGTALVYQKYMWNADDKKPVVSGPSIVVNQTWKGNQQNYGFTLLPNNKIFYVWQSDSNDAEGWGIVYRILSHM